MMMFPSLTRDLYRAGWSSSPALKHHLRHMVQSISSYQRVEPQALTGVNPSVHQQFRHHCQDLIWEKELLRIVHGNHSAADFAAH